MTFSPSAPERRKHPRIGNTIPLKISSEDADFVTETYNLSRTGAYCKVNKYVQPMTKLKIHLLIPVKKNNRMVTRKISCQGIVVRTEPVAGQSFFKTAIFFSDIQHKDADYISDYIHEELEKQKAISQP